MSNLQLAVRIAVPGLSDVQARFRLPDNATRVDSLTFRTDVNPVNVSFQVWAQSDPNASVVGSGANLPIIEGPLDQRLRPRILNQTVHPCKRLPAGFNILTFEMCNGDGGLIQFYITVAVSSN